MKGFDSCMVGRVMLGGIVLFLAVANAPGKSLPAIAPVAEESRHPIQGETDLDSKAVQLGVGESRFASLDSEKFFSCGRNALYMFLLMSGHSEVSFDQVKAEVPLTSPKGASMLSLRDAATKLGLDAEVRLYGLQDYDSVPLPAIFHIRKKNLLSWVTHFDVMYKRDKEFVYLINGTTGLPFSVRREKFSSGDWWTGYSLIEKRSIFASAIDNWPVLAACFLVADILLVALWLQKVKRSPLERQVSGSEVLA